jgi:hypothetical protein
MAHLRKEANVNDLEESRTTARNLISVHGQRALAIVHEREQEARLQGDASGLARWQNVEAAIADLRRTEPASH